MLFGVVRIAVVAACSPTCDQPHKSEPAVLGWQDDRNAKWTALRVWGNEEWVKRGEAPLLWLDAACVAPDVTIDRSLALLPLYLAGVQQTVILAGPTFLSRLWCACSRELAVQRDGVHAICRRDDAVDMERGSIRPMHGSMHGQMYGESVLRSSTQVCDGNLLLPPDGWITRTRDGGASG